MNRRPVTCEASDDIRLDTYLKNSSNRNSQSSHNLINHRENPDSISKSRSGVNGLIGRDKFRNKTAKIPSQELEDMDQPLNGQYRHFPPADDAGGDSSDILNSSSIGDDQLSRRRLVSSNNANSTATNNPTSRDSDIDNEAPDLDEEDDDHDGNNTNEIYHLRRQQRRQQQRLRRRDTSSASVCGDSTSRRRPPISLSRSSTRIGQTSIPPPPSEPPPSLPPCIDSSSQYSMYPVLGGHMGFNITSQQPSTGTPPTMLHVTGLPINYLPPGGIMNAGDASHQFLQMQQAALIQQHQQQQLQQRIASVNAAAAAMNAASGNSYLSGFATVGRPMRNPPLNQGQMTLPHHQPIPNLELISTTALLQAHVAAQAQAQNNAAPSAGGSGSVVYENSYNSFQSSSFNPFGDS
ncbi:unnamed protein product [Rodentolepis nana]|uniref:Dr1-associated corepressor n=1 Tax=Rodentolepis nana TaxID=102285 RepID=A0A0R3TNH0_RODNA|nr:unnamed protein product [Rodentolepis nana]